MTQFTSQWLADYERRNAPRTQDAPSEDGVDLEVRELHRPILEWCRAQVPEVPVIYARSDVRSTLRPGTHDFTVFFQGQVFCIECKRRTGKLDEDQRNWCFLMERHGWVVHVVRSFQQFLELVRAQPPVARPILDSTGAGHGMISPHH